MSKRFYGSLNNRFEEGKNYAGEIKPGTDITMYLWSDRHPYYVTDVVNQKDIFVKRYEVCADQDKEGGPGHQNWMYFKTLKEHNEYLSKYFPDHDYNLNPEESEAQEWVFRYGKWKEKVVYNLDKWNKAIEKEREIYKDKNESQIKDMARWDYFRLSDEEFEKVMSGEEVVKYYDLSGKISFGILNFYYDWSF